MHVDLKHKFDIFSKLLSLHPINKNEVSLSKLKEITCENCKSEMTVAMPVWGFVLFVCFLF